MKKQVWDRTTKRYVAFFDILGFKELVLQNTHLAILKKLEVLKSHIEELQGDEWTTKLEKYRIGEDHTRAVTFSDSIIVFSRSNTPEDALKLVVDCYDILRISFNNSIPIKGAVSYGDITVDFEKSLFFGQPIIDAYLLHEDLQMLTVISDHNFDTQWDKVDKPEVFQDIFILYKAILRSGRISHKLLRPIPDTNVDNRIINLNKLYSLTSGRPRIYLDNTLDFLNSLKGKV